MTPDEIDNLYFKTLNEINNTILQNKEIFHARMNYIVYMVTSSVFDFNLLEKRLDDIILHDYFLDDVHEPSAIYKAGVFQLEVLRSGTIDFSKKVDIVNDIMRRHDLLFKKKRFIALAGIRNQIAHGIMNFDPDSKTGVEICLYGREMKKIDFEKLGNEFTGLMKNCSDELDRVYQKLGMFVPGDTTS